MKRLSLIYTLLFVAVSSYKLTSCTAPPREFDGPFLNAVEFIQIGKRKEAQKTFKTICHWGATAACFENKQKDQVIFEERLSIHQAGTNSNVARFVVLSPKNNSNMYFVYPELRDSGDNLPTSIYIGEFKRKSREFSNWAVDQVQVKGLDKGIIYVLDVVGKDGKLRDRRKFSTLDLNRSPFSVAVASCLNDRFKVEQDRLWKKMEGQEIDALFLIGDNAYVTISKGIPGSADPEQIWSRYVETWKNIRLFKRVQLVPIYATWDDNDYGKSNGDKNFKYKIDSKIIFSDFFFHEPLEPSLLRGPGLSSSLSLNYVQFVFMDNRSFRSPNINEDNYKHLSSEVETHWGSEQENWLYRNLGKKGPPIVLIQGDQFFGGYHPFESYEGSHPKSFAKFKEKIKTNKKPVLFISGDRHIFELMRIKKSDIGFESFEITSSPAHSKLYPGRWEKRPNPRLIKGIDLHHLYTVLKFKKGNGHLSIDLKVHGMQEKSLYEKALIIRR